MNKLRLPVLLFILLLTAGCGFHLRGSVPGAEGPAAVVINATGAPTVGDAVRTMLESGGTDTNPESKTAYRLLLTDQAINRSVLSVSPVTGKVEEYQLTLTVNMAITHANGQDILTPQPIRIARDFAFRDEAVLGSVAEQRVLEQEMINQAAGQIIRRLNAVTR